MNFLALDARENEPLGSKQQSPQEHPSTSPTGPKTTSAARDRAPHPQTKFSKGTMLSLKTMTPAQFQSFARESQRSYADALAKVEDVPLATALEYASQQFNKIAPSGLATENQLFFAVTDAATDHEVGFLWLGFQTSFERKIAAIFDIAIDEKFRGQGFGKALMKLVENEAQKAAAVRVRLHVFNHNEVAKKLYESMGFRTTSLEIRKDL